MIGKFIRIAHKHGYKIFKEPFKINIWGVRSPETKSGQFDDQIFVFYNTAIKGRPNWKILVFPCTTDPGTFWLNQPMNQQGTAILKQGQYSGYKIGLHRGKYEALVQRKPVTVIRDYDRNATLDFNNGNEYSGLFGINIHRARKTGVTPEVQDYSAGCQVLQSAEHFDTLMNLAKMHRQYYGNDFSYTLIDLRALKRANRKMLAVGSLAFIGMGAIGWLYWKYFGQKNQPAT